MSGALRSRGSATVLVIMVIAVLLPFVPGILFLYGLWTKWDLQRDNDTCEANLRVVGQSLLSYAEADGGVFPRSLAVLLEQDLIDSSNLMCSRNPVVRPSTCSSYVYLPGLSSEDDLSEMVVLYHTWDDHIGGAWTTQGGGYVFLGDGRVKIEYGARFETAINRTKQVTGTETGQRK